MGSSWKELFIRFIIYNLKKFAKVTFTMPYAMSAILFYIYILSNNRNLTVVNFSIILENQKFKKSEVHTNILCFETDKLLIPFDSRKKHIRAFE